MKQKLKSSLLLFFGCIVPSFGELTLEGFYWMMEPSGRGSIGQNAIVGTHFDLEEDLGFGATENITGATVVLGGRLSIGGSFVHIDIEAQNSIEKDINIQGLNFTVNSDISSVLETQILRGFIRAGPSRGNFSIAGEAGVIYADVSTTASGAGIGRASVDVSGGTLYAGAHVKMFITSNLGLQGGFRYSSWNFEAFEYDYFEYELSARLKIATFFGGAGYRSLTLDGTDSDENFDLELELAGPIIYGGFEF
jgi:hypothetical protein